MGIKALLALEALEQAGWETCIPAWHPRNESGAGDGGGDGGDGGDGGGDAGGDGGSGGEGAPDIGKLFSSFEGFRNDVVQRFDGLEQRIPAPADEDDEDDEDEGGQPSPEFFDPRRFSDEDFDEHGQLTRDAQTRELRSMFEGWYAEARAPELAAQADERRTSQANALEQKHPIFADPEKRQPILREAQGRAAAMAEAVGNPALRDAWREPEFLEMVHLAMVGSQALAGESPAGGGGKEVTLERGGSAGPASAGDDGGKAIAKSIVGLATKSKYRLGG